MGNYVQSVMDLLKYTFINPAEESSLIGLSSGIIPTVLISIIPTKAIRRMQMTKENLLWVLSLIFIW